MRARLLVVAVFVAAAAVPALLAYSTGVISSPSASGGESALGREFRVTSLAWPRGAQGLTASSGLVVWEQEAAGGDGGNELCVYDLQTRQTSRLLAAPRVGAGVGAPDMTGSTVAWAARRGASSSRPPQVRGFDSETGRLFTAAGDGVLARSAGNAVVWAVRAGSHLHGRDTIGVLDTVTDTTLSLSAGGCVQDLAACGRLIAWVAGPPDGGTVWALRRPSRSPVKLGSGSRSVDADARRIVWSTEDGAHHTSIMLWDAATRRARLLCRVAASVDSLELGADAVAWRQSTGDGDVGVFDFARGRAFTLCANGAPQADPVVAGRTVFWADGRSGSWELYGREL
jgi:hypothetical protein